MKGDTKTVDVTYFTPDIPDLSQSGIRQYWDQVPTLIKDNPKITFRRIATVESSEKFEWLLKDMTKFKDTDGFNLRIIDTNIGTLLLNVIVVNDEEIFIFGPHRPESDRVQKYVYVKNSEIGSAIAAYFGHIWSSALVIKQGQRIHQDQILRIRKNFGKQ
jgi:hypothetical protein